MTKGTDSVAQKAFLAKIETISNYELARLARMAENSMVEAEDSKSRAQWHSLMQFYLLRLAEAGFEEMSRLLDETRDEEEFHESFDFNSL